MAKKDEGLLPEETDNNAELDVSDLRVNFSEEEASSESMDFEPIPGGKYPCKITDYEVRYSKSEKNNGKPYWALTLTVQEGKYENRKLFANVMLFEGALYSLAQLLKATGHHEALKTGKIPSGSDLLGQDVVVNVAKMRDKYKEEQYADGEVYFKNEVKGFKPADALAGASGEGSLLP